MNEIIFSYFFYISMAIFFATFTLMYFACILPTRRAVEKEKRLWKVRWNHVEFVMLVTWMAAVFTALPDANNAFTKYFADHNQEVADLRRDKANELALDAFEYACIDANLGEPTESCRLLRLFMSTKATDAHVWAELSGAFTTEIKVTAKAGIKSRIEGEMRQLAIYASEVSSFLTTRDLLQSAMISAPSPEYSLIFLPFLVAFGFALQLAKVVAAYSLL